MSAKLSDFFCHEEAGAEDVRSSGTHFFCFGELVPLRCLYRIKHRQNAAKRVRREHLPPFMEYSTPTSPYRRVVYHLGCFLIRSVAAAGARGIDVDGAILGRKATGSSTALAGVHVSRVVDWSCPMSLEAHILRRNSSSDSLRLPYLRNEEVESAMEVLISLL